MKWFYTPSELKNEFQKMNDEMNEAKELDKQEQLDRVESKLDELMEFLKNTQPR